MARTTKNMRREMELQLHEQYAINHNSNLSSILSLFVVMVGVIGVYGYVYVHSICEYAPTFSNLLAGDNLYYLDVLMLTAMASIIVLGIIVYLCINIGGGQRLEQFITFAIRMKYYRENNSVSNHYKDIFPKRYSPFGKKCFKLIQGPYDAFIKICVTLAIIVIFSLLVKLLYNMAIFPCCSYCCRACIEWWLFFIILIITIVCCWISCRNLCNACKAREDYYSKLLNIKDIEKI